MYVPLYIKTNYSLLSSVIKIDTLIERAKQNHFSSLAITDNNMFGTMEFYQKCKAAGIHAIIGLEIELENDINLKTKITLDLPTGNILENGIETTETTNMKTVFKRI